MRLLLLLLLFPATIKAQHLQQEINMQVWKPFMTAYQSFDTEKFMALHTKDVVRIPRDQKQIFTFADYKKNIARENQFNKNYNINASIEFRFTERIHQQTHAFETGIYKLNILKDNIGKSTSLYGRFRVILRKENNVWKIAVDEDSTEDNTISEKDFLAAKPME